jgi:hypothetical protein
VRYLPRRLSSRTLIGTSRGGCFVCSFGRSSSVAGGGGYGGRVAMPLEAAFHLTGAWLASGADVDKGGGGYREVLSPRGVARG